MSRKGIYRAVCDVCGFEFNNYELQKRWDGLMVCREDYETRHIQDFIKIPPDSTKLPWTRPENLDLEVSNSFDTSLRDCGIYGAFSHADYGEADCMEADNFNGALEVT